MMPDATIPGRSSTMLPTRVLRMFITTTWTSWIKTDSLSTCSQVIGQQEIIVFHVIQTLVLFSLSFAAASLDRSMYCNSMNIGNIQRSKKNRDRWPHRSNTLGQQETVSSVISKTLFDGSLMTLRKTYIKHVLTVHLMTFRLPVLFTLSA